MKQALPSRLLVTLSVGALALWIAASQPFPTEPMPFEPAAATTPYQSPYPAPQVDASAPPQEPAPTF